jgi:predicted aminopeptidase
VDSLGYKPTRNFTTFYDQEGQPLLWVVTGCKPFEFKAHYWKFPIVGTVSYKGFFNIALAQQEYLRLLRMGYDADMAPVSAWSTLGWLPDPVLSGMLKRSKGKLVNLLFHELFHATYYAPGTVDVNENLANFIAYKATLNFLARDSVELDRFRYGVRDDSVYNKFTLERYDTLQRFYERTVGMDSLRRLEAKQKILVKIYRDASMLPLHNARRFKMSNWSILQARNAFFIDARRYDGLYDSLDNILKTKYKNQLRAMIEDLKK